MPTPPTLAERGLALSLARWLSGSPPAASGEAAEPSALEKECAQLHDKGDAKGLAAALRAPLLGRLASAKEGEARSSFAVFVQLLVRWQLLMGQAEALSADVVGAKLPTDLACALLLSLFALVQQAGAPAELRFSLLRTMIPFCAERGSLGSVLGPGDGRIARVEGWVSEWGLSTAQQQELWALVFDSHTEEGPLLYESALKYVALHEDAELKATPALRERIVKALLITIRSPDLFRCDELSQSKAVAQLAKDAEFAPLHRLLHIMARDTYSEFLAFAAEAPSKAFLTKHALPVEACGDKMRLLTLVSLALAQKELTYAAVATALRVEVGEVEEWVMRAIGAGLITAKMDQASQVIGVSMCAERDFGKAQWERLHTSLVDWRKSINGLLEVVQSSRPASVA